MYKSILVPLENSMTDQAILRHIVPFARLHAARVVLMHVADGFVARNQDQFNLQDSEEMQADRAYLERCREELQGQDVQTSYILGAGDPASEIIKAAEKESCDLIAMATHGHKLLGDLMLGSVAEKLRHRTTIPILMIRAAA